MREPNPTACPQCLRRARLLADLGPYIEQVASGAPGARSVELLALANEELAVAAAPKVAEQVLARVESIPEEKLRADLTSAGCWALCRHEALYPVGLRDAEDAPWALFGRGEPRLVERLGPEDAVAIVGSRRATAYGRATARELGRDLAAAGLVVCSGMAYGVDACAHRGALEGGVTAAVLGCGPDIAYPSNHRALWRRISELGVVLSELPPGTGAWRWTFPARNRILAGMAGMTIVVEAAARSGSLVTARFAGELGRPLGAVPGPVSSRASAGTNQLLVDGARLVRSADDVLAALGESH
jgi:DNA processing protein